MFASLAKWIWSGFAFSLSGLIGRAFVAMGIGYATYNFVMPDFVAFVQGQIGGLPGNMVAVLAAAKVDVAVTIIFSAVATKLASRIFFRRV